VNPKVRNLEEDGSWLVTPTRLGEPAAEPGQPAKVRSRRCGDIEYQVRMNRLKAGTSAAFLDAWRAGVYPLRQRFGFTMRGAWIDEDGRTFIWILGYNGPDGFAAADAAYYASPERAALRPDPAQYFEVGEHIMVRPVLPLPHPSIER